MRHLWLITAIMVVAGAAMILASLVAGAGPIILIGGVLLVWSGLIKTAVLRVWGVFLESPPVAEPMSFSRRNGQAADR